MILSITKTSSFDTNTLYDGAGRPCATIDNIQPLILTKELFDRIQPGEVFRIVTTNLQNFYEPGKMYLKFVCKKGDSGLDWAVYCGKPDKSDLYIATSGDKVHGRETLLSICPCDDEVLKLYRR